MHIAIQRTFKHLTLGLLLFYAYASAGLPIYQVSGLASETASLAIQVQNGVASGGDFVMLIESGPMLTILKKNTDGMYSRFAGKFIQELSCSISTNGVWFAVSQGNAFEIFTLDEAGNFIRVTRILETGHIHNLNVAADDSVTIFKGDALVTYAIFPETAAWEPISTTPINTATSLCGHFTDSSFAGIDTIRGVISLFTRQENGSWTNIDNFAYDTNMIRDIASVTWSGDTIILSKLVPCSTYGVTYVFIKVNGHWTRSTTRGAGEIDLQLGLRLIKANVLMIDASTAYVSVLAPAPPPPRPEDGDPNHQRSVQRESSPPVIGRVFLLKRVNGEWIYQAKIVPPVEMTMEFGAGIVMTAENHFFFGCEMKMNSPPSCGFFSLGDCFADPVELTCEDVLIQDCGLLNDQIDVNLIYTLNNPQCGRPFGILSSVIVRNMRTLDYSFLLYKPFSNDMASCNMTATCPVPITSIEDMPAAHPVTVHVSRPKNETEVISSANKVMAAVSLSLATLFVV